MRPYQIRCSVGLQAGQQPAEASAGSLGKEIFRRPYCMDARGDAHSGSFLNQLPVSGSAEIFISGPQHICRSNRMS